MGLYFRGLDYACFASLLYDDPASRNLAGQTVVEEVFLAADIATFRLERQSLYKEFRIERGEAVYLFEPVYLESVPADGDGGGDPGTVAGRSQTPETRAVLDVDEFIASAWAKGVRFGIDVAAVKEGIALDKPERRIIARSKPRIIARSKPYVAGKDAEIVEQAPGLHRNNAPRRLLGGRVDLRQFETRYPQVAAAGEEDAANARRRRPRCHR